MLWVLAERHEHEADWLLADRRLQEWLRLPAGAQRHDLLWELGVWQLSDSQLQDWLWLLADRQLHD